MHSLSRAGRGSSLYARSLGATKSRININSATTTVPPASMHSLTSLLALLFSSPSNSANEMKTWENIWQGGVDKGQAFDAAQTEPYLVKLLNGASPALPEALPTSKAFVPGCGRGYSVVSLAKAGYTAQGLELSETAASKAREYFESENMSEEKCSVLVGDFFKVEEENQYSVIFDSTFLCAIPPETRTQWASKMKGILSPDGELIMNVFPLRPDSPDPADGEVGTGPPYTMSIRLVEDLLLPLGFTKILEEPVPQELKARFMAGEAFMRWKAPTP